MERLWVKKRFKTRMKNATRKVNKRFRIRLWRSRRAGWWRSMELITNTKRIQQLTTTTSKGRHTGMSGLWSWDCSQLMIEEEWPMRMVELIEKAGLWWDRAGNVEKKTAGGAYVVEITLYLMRSSQCSDLRIWSGLPTRWPKSCNNSTSKSILGMLKAI